MNVSFDIVGAKVEINAERIKEQGFLYLQDLAGDDFEIFCQENSSYFFIGIPVSLKKSDITMQDFEHYVMERLYIEFPFLGIRDVVRLTGTITENRRTKL